MYVIIRIGTEFLVLSNATAVSGSVTGCVVQKAKPHRLKICNWLTSFWAVMAGKLYETTVQYTCLENLSLLLLTGAQNWTTVTKKCAMKYLQLHQEAVCSTAVSSYHLLRVEKVTSREAVETQGCTAESLHVWQKRDNGLLSCDFSQMLFYPLFFLLLHFGMLQWTTHQRFLELGPLRSCWFHCWD